MINIGTKNEIPIFWLLDKDLEAADNTILIYRPEVYGKYYKEPFQNISTKGTAQIEVAKGRNIGLTKFIVTFIPEIHYLKIMMKITSTRTIN